MSSEYYDRVIDRLEHVWIAPAVAAGLLLAACSPAEAPIQAAAPISAEPFQPTTGSAPVQEQTSTAEGLADQVLKDRAASVTSTFEYSTTEKQYGKAQNIDDGRGITAGWFGVTSGTSDMLYLVEDYTKRRPDNVLAKYLPALQAIDALPLDERDTTKGLDGLIGDWESLGDDPEFRQVQDDICDELYFGPAMKRAEAAGVKTPLGQLIIWDSIIQHGEGEDEDGLPNMLQEMIDANGRVQNDEAAWLAKFLEVRRHHLMYAADGKTREAWQDSVSRVDALKSILDTDNLSLKEAVDWEVYTDLFHLDAVK